MMESEEGGIVLNIGSFGKPSLRLSHKQKVRGTKVLINRNNRVNSENACLFYHNKLCRLSKGSTPVSLP